MLCSMWSISCAIFEAKRDAWAMVSVAVAEVVTTARDITVRATEVVNMEAEEFDKISLKDIPAMGCPLLFLY